MSYLDDELARLEKYIAGLGIKLIKRSKQEAGSQSVDFGTWCPGEIELYFNEHSTKVELILTLLHEIGHQLYYMHNDKPAIPSEVLLPIETLTKAQRKKILDYEKSGIALMPIIAIELGLKIPLWKVYRQVELDTFMYEYFYEHGIYPTAKARKAEKLALNKLYKGKKIV